MILLRSSTRWLSIFQVERAEEISRHVAANYFVPCSTGERRASSARIEFCKLSIATVFYYPFIVGREFTYPPKDIRYPNWRTSFSCGSNAVQTRSSSISHHS
jgi:hypothetical protein